MIDPTKLPGVALVDTGVLIRALGQRPDDNRAPMCVAFWNEMLRQGNLLLIAAPTVTEVMRNIDYPPLPVPSLPNVIVVAFDHGVAIELAKKFPEQVLRAQNSQNLPIDYMRYDALILACALKYDAVLVTMDVDLVALAKKGGVKSARVEDYAGKQIPMQFPPQPIPPSYPPGKE